MCATPSRRRFHTGWSARLSTTAGATLLFLTASGLAVTFGPFHPAVQWGLVIHTVIGIVTILPLVWYCAVHWHDYRRYQLSPVVLLGYVAGAGLLMCLVSGTVVTWQGLAGTRMSSTWRQTHLISTFVILAGALPHVVLLLVRGAKVLPASIKLERISGFASVYAALDAHLKKAVH